MRTKQEEMNSVLITEVTLVMTRSCTIATQRYIVVPRYVVAIGFASPLLMVIKATNISFNIMAV